MANFEIPLNPEFSTQLRKFETTDPAHAELFNNVIEILLNNDVFLRAAAEKLVQDMQQRISDSQATLDSYYQQSTGYTNQMIADLIDGAPTTLDTIGKISNAMQNNPDVVEALETAIGSKANESEFSSYKNVTEALIGNTDISGVGDGTLTGAINAILTKLGGFFLYPEKMTQAQYNALPEETKNTQGLIFVVVKE